MQDDGRPTSDEAPQDAAAPSHPPVQDEAAAPPRHPVVDDRPLVPDRSADDSDTGWGDGYDSNDDRLLRDVPPHW